MIWIESGAIWGVIGVLLAFGVLYNGAVGWLAARGYDEGYVALLVVVGVLVTLLGVGVVNVQAAITALLCFVASGTPMVVGSVGRYMVRRAQATEGMVAEATVETRMVDFQPGAMDDD